MSLASKFKSFGHAIAAGAKYLEVGILDAVKVAQKVESLSPVAIAILSATVAPGITNAADVAFHLLGDFATALKNANAQTLQAISEKGLVVQTDVATLEALKELAQTIEKVLQARGTPAPQ